MTKSNVLIFPAGEINSVELHDALSHNVNINVFRCSSVNRHGEYIFKNYKSGLPNIFDENFIEEFNKVIKEWSIDFIFPTHDTVALFLTKNQYLIQAKVIASSYETAVICRDKKLTYDLFSDKDFCPFQYNSLEQLPVFVKPRDGQGAQGTKLIKNKSDILTEIDIEKYVISEYLPGDEMTVDCLTDSKGNLSICLPRIRKRILAGVCVAGETCPVSSEIMEIATIINERLDFLGLWYFQIKKSSEGKFKLLEISTRCAGTMCLSRARGVNLPLLSVYAAQGKDITIFENQYSLKVDRTLISRYKIDYVYNTVYIDYDDTIIDGGEVVLPVIKFLYQCKNKGIEVILLTRHEEDHNDSIEESLISHAISKELFTKIIKLSFDERKSSYITGKSIFIDNSYAERKAVHDTIGIPVFDVEGIEVIEDWRC